MLNQVLSAMETGTVSFNKKNLNIIVKVSLKDTARLNLVSYVDIETVKN